MTKTLAMKINYKQVYLDYHNCTLESDYSSGYDFEMSTEYTADSYNVYLCKYVGEPTYIADHVYYYTNDLEDVLKEKIEECDKVFCDEEIQDELHIEWEQWCEEEGIIKWDDDNEEYKIAGDEE